MMNLKGLFKCCCYLLFLNSDAFSQGEKFVSVKQQHFYIGVSKYNFIGANYWYGGLLADNDAGKERVKRELDFLMHNGVNNLRLFAGTEGTGLINGMPRVEPSLQPTAGNFDTILLARLDYLLVEMGKRNMKAVIFISNNWEWSGGFLQYLNWNGSIPDSILRRKLTWDETRDYVAGFYDCDKCILQYNNQLNLIVSRKNSLTGQNYRDDPTIMSWELANEPRPMRPAAIGSFKKWISKTASHIRKLDKNHLITIGSEGEIGSESMEVFQAVHADPNIDYATIHIWPKNWAWFKDTAISKDMNHLTNLTLNYIDKHNAVMTKLKKPLVIEEFGLPRDHHLFEPGSPTAFRDTYYSSIFQKLLESINTNGAIAGANFWAFSGMGRPLGKFWQKGDNFLGDPPFEEQGLNSVFDSDSSTWNVIRFYAEQIRPKSRR